MIFYQNKVKYKVCLSLYNHIFQKRFPDRTSANVLNPTSVLLSGPVKNERNNNNLLSLDAIIEANSNSCVPSR